MAVSIDVTGELYPSGGPGTFYLGRSEELLSDLLNRHANAVQLIYLDPPFGTGDLFRMQIGRAGIERPAYSDVLTGEEYLKFLRPILEGCRDLLSPTGSLYLHVDYRMAAPLKLMLDGIFGEKNFMNEIIWMYRSGGRSTRHFSRKHDTILFYRKSSRCYFDIEGAGIPRGPERRNHMKRSIDEKGRVTYSIRSGGKLYHYHEDSLVYPSDVWTDIEHLHQRDPERNGYATQKPEALLRRILSVSSRPGDLVADLFSGSGTTAAAAAQMGRRFLASDSSPFALYALRRRMASLFNPVSLLETAEPFTLFFPASAPPAAVDAACTQSKDSVTCTVQKYEADKASPLVYCALGRVKDGIFRPAASTHTPALPLTLCMPAASGAPVLQTVDAEGRQGFWVPDK
ncbi:MAG TPA: site-specific DNA-methyltransferase [Feifaniaceae bacterium]|nr:site-specific DNA-methyltransferase [Feifaniaceae bacterium]